MSKASEILAEIWRGDILESVHRGAVAVCGPDGGLVEAFGDPERVILPRSSCKMVQALPLVESGAADRFGLTPEHLALACASHEGTPLHTGLASRWLDGIGRDESALRCGAQPPYHKPTRIALRQAGEAPCQLHNNCSGKHCGFVTVAAHLEAGPEYIEIDHPVQRAVKAATEEVADETAAGHAVDGCSAPNFAITLRGLAASMARFARPAEAFTGSRAAAAERLRTAMAAHPVLVDGEGEAATELMRACGQGTAVKSGAEGVFVAILPERGLGIAVKVDDGNKRGSEAAIAAMLVRHGALDRAHPEYARRADAPIFNWRGIAHGHLRAGPVLTG